MSVAVVYQSDFERWILRGMTSLQKKASEQTQRLQTTVDRRRRLDRLVAQMLAIGAKIRRGEILGARFAGGLPTRKSPQISQIISDRRRRKGVLVEIGFEMAQELVELGALIGGVTICNVGDAVRWFSIAGGENVIVRIQL